ncbi:MAG: hypothetical protein QNK17_10210 [Hyphomicrobiaceae bacterium]|jgi:hypothetical protein|nr:hypothetical protein [Hyphomicrobiaceae bacterium]MDX2450781.1 hypothetical protein [Hyphomicrobiaceae bacterium]
MPVDGRVGAKAIRPSGANFLLSANKIFPKQKIRPAGDLIYVSAFVAKERTRQGFLNLVQAIPELDRVEALSRLPDSQLHKSGGPYARCGRFKRFHGIQTG